MTNFSSQEVILMALEAKSSKNPNKMGQVLAPEFAVGRPG